MHRVELLIWHCAEFTIYHGNIRLVSFSEQQRYHSFLSDGGPGRTWTRGKTGEVSSC